MKAAQRKLFSQGICIIPIHKEIPVFFCFNQYSIAVENMSKKTYILKIRSKYNFDMWYYGWNDIRSFVHGQDSNRDLRLRAGMVQKEWIDLTTNGEIFG